jgi:hypothetical protein
VSSRAGADEPLLCCQDTSVSVRKRVLKLLGDLHGNVSAELDGAIVVGVLGRTQDEESVVKVRGCAFGWAGLGCILRAAW